MPQLLKQQILDMNAAKSKEFVDNINLRRTYRGQYKTHLAATMCMDGRVNVRRAAGLPFGIVYPFRNIGGKYNVGWPLMRDSLDQWADHAHGKYHEALLMTTYHWSKTDAHLGCRGFNYDRDAAVAGIRQFRDQVASCYGKRIWPVLVGIETDSDALIFHGLNGEVLDLREVPLDNLAAFFEKRLAEMYPDFPDVVLSDMIPLLLGNVNHLRKNGSSHQEKFLAHRERVLAIGQGFDWLDNDNFALIIGPCEPALDNAIVTAASILQSNVTEGRIDANEKGVLLISTPYRRSIDRLAAIEQSRYLAEFAMKHIGEQIPEMRDFFDPLVTIINLDDRRLEICG